MKSYMQSTIKVLVLSARAYLPLYVWIDRKIYPDVIYPHSKRRYRQLNNWFWTPNGAPTQGRNTPFSLSLIFTFYLMNCFEVLIQSYLPSLPTSIMNQQPTNWSTSPIILTQPAGGTAHPASAHPSLESKGFLYIMPIPAYGQMAP